MVIRRPDLRASPVKTSGEGDTYLESKDLEYFYGGYGDTSCSYIDF